VICSSKSRWIIKLSFLALLGTVACSSAPPPAVEQDDPPPGVRVTRDSPGFSASPSQLEEGRQLIENAIEAIGGETVLDGIRTLVIDARVQYGTEGGGGAVLEVKTSIEFPNRFRREANTPDGSLVTVVTPDDSFVIVVDTIFDLSDYERFRLEDSILHHPIPLLKTRNDPTFRAISGKQAEVDGRSAQLVDVEVMAKKTTLALEEATGRILETRFTMVSETGGVPQRAVVRFSDFREMDGLVFPFSGSMTVDGVEVVSTSITRVTVNDALPNRLFIRPAARIPHSPEDSGD
jgi:outer membrane lipoprotein-sorting protein